MYEIRKYQSADARALVDIIYNTIHIVLAQDYSLTQLEAMAPTTNLKLGKWKKKWSKVPPIVATTKNKIVGFAELEANGHIDCFYCHHEWIGKGVGSTLMQAIETSATELKIPRIFAEVSITAKPFFLKQGFAEIKKQTIFCEKVAMVNFMMEKYIISKPFVTS